MRVGNPASASLLPANPTGGLRDRRSVPLGKLKLVDPLAVMQRFQKRRAADSSRVSVVP